MENFKYKANSKINVFANKNCLAIIELDVIGKNKKHCRVFKLFENRLCYYLAILFSKKKNK